MTHQAILLEAKAQAQRHRVQEEHRLPPRGVDFVPLDGHRRQTSQTEVVDGAKVSVVPDVEHIVEHVGFLKLFQLVARQMVLVGDGVVVFQELVQLQLILIVSA